MDLEKPEDSVTQQENVTSKRKLKSKEKLKSKCWTIPEGFDSKNTKLDPKGLFIFCEICNIPVKVRSKRPYTFSRWIEHTRSISHVTKNEHKKHIILTKLRKEKEDTLSKEQAAVLK